MLRRWILSAVIGIAYPTVSVSAATTVGSVGDAAISHDADSGLWSISAGGSTLTLVIDPTQDFQPLRLVTTSHRSWNVAPISGFSFSVNGKPFVFGSRNAGFVYRSVTTFLNEHGVQLDATFDLASASLRVTRHYRAVSGSPTFEVWNTIEPIDTEVAVGHLTAFRATLPRGTVHWLAGLQGDGAHVPNDESFTLHQRNLALGDHFSIGAQGRASELTVPWVTIDGLQDEFFVALMWSGAWELTVDATTAGLAVSLDLGSMTTTSSSRPTEGPHVLFGAVPGGLAQAAAALHEYVLWGIRGGRPLTPLVTFNTWFGLGTRFDEDSIRGQMLRAAALGVELFVMDAGWYAGAGRTGVWDFESGLGSYEADPARFPHGLKALTDYAHELGMKFGLWVEPERVTLATMDGSGIDESWLAMAGGKYGSDRAAQICFASDAARRWVLDQLTKLLNAVQPDYLKWDNNMWINCDRAGHGHGSSDGNFAHVNGLYAVLATLRERFPSLLIENVSGGGNRLDLGMLRYTDVAWMDDRTAPAVHVRHNVQGLSAVFPPAYLLSFVTDDPKEPLRRAPDLSLYFRSRMEGVLGLSFKNVAFADSDLSAMSHEIAIYKSVRDTLVRSAGSLLTPQASTTDGPSWDVLQETASGGTAVVVSAVQSDRGTGKINVKPEQLSPDVSYDVLSMDTGRLGTATGAELMANGIDVLNSPATAAHILVLRALP